MLVLKHSLHSDSGQRKQASWLDSWSRERCAAGATDAREWAANEEHIMIINKCPRSYNIFKLCRQKCSMSQHIKDVTLLYNPLSYASNMLEVAL